MSLSAFANGASGAEATLTVLNREAERPLYRMLQALFDEDAITIQETRTDNFGVESPPTDVILIENDHSDPAFAVSSLAEVRDALLFVNSDIHVTGVRDLEDIDTPDVITALVEIPFTVEGFPRDRNEKLLLIEISRHIEAMAFQAGEGRLDTGFQSLSRVADERGTRRVYERLGTETAVETHLYGLPDVEVSIPGTTAHGHTTPEIQHSWFVVYQSDAHPDEAAALVAIETAPNTWEGRWTYDAQQVQAIRAYLDDTYR